MFKNKSNNIVGNNAKLWYSSQSSLFLLHFLPYLLCAFICLSFILVIHNSLEVKPKFKVNTFQSIVYEKSKHFSQLIKKLNILMLFSSIVLHPVIDLHSFSSDFGSIKNSFSNVSPVLGAGLIFPLQIWLTY